MRESDEHERLDPHESAIFPQDLDIIRILPWEVPPGTPVVRFDQPSWDLSHLPTWPKYARYRRLLWTSIGNPYWRTTAKEATLCLMQPRFALERRLANARRHPFPPWAMHNERISYWRRWFAFLEAEGFESMSSVSQTECDAFLASITPPSKSHAVASLRIFADYAPALTHDRLDFRPWGKVAASLTSGLPNVGSNQNKTPVIPDRVFAPLLEGALFFTETVAPNLNKTRAEAARPEFRPSARGGVPPDFDGRLDAYLERMRSENRSLPAAKTATARNRGISIVAIAQSINLKEPRHLLREDRWEKITSAAQLLGTVVPWRGLNVALDGKLELGHRPSDPAYAAKLVRTACLVIVAALSGMRHSELAAIRRGAYFTEDRGLGLVRHHVRSLLLKGQPPGGRSETWTVIEPVVEALKVAESLTEEDHPLTVAHFELQYRDLRDWINTFGGMSGLEPVPDDWQVSLRQFRRTLARELAWRPNGVIAAKIHLKHISVATTEGYAGRRGESASAFLKEVEREQSSAREHAVREVIAAIDRGEPVTGLGAKSLRAAVTSLPDTTEVGPQTRERDDAVVALIASRAEIFYPMPLAHCWFTDPNRARCLRHQADKSRPIGASCQPSRCVNATIHAEHASVWLSGIEELEASLKSRSIGAGERERVGLKISAARAVVEDLGDPR